MSLILAGSEQRNAGTASRQIFLQCRIFATAIWAEECLGFILFLDRSLSGLSSIRCALGFQHNAGRAVFAGQIAFGISKFQLKEVQLCRLKGFRSLALKKARPRGWVFRLQILRPEKSWRRATIQPAASKWSAPQKRRGRHSRFTAIFPGRKGRNCSTLLRRLLRLAATRSWSGRIARRRCP